MFVPDRGVAERAQRIVAAYAEATASGDGIVSVDGQIVDEATNRMAKEIVAEAEAVGVL